MRYPKDHDKGDDKRSGADGNDDSTQDQGTHRAGS
jgi:hypothetical protein